MSVHTLDETTFETWVASVPCSAFIGGPTDRHLIRIFRVAVGSTEDQARYRAALIWSRGRSCDQPLAPARGLEVRRVREKAVRRETRGLIYSEASFARPGEAKPYSFWHIAAWLDHCERKRRDQRIREAASFGRLHRRRGLI